MGRGGGSFGRGAPAGKYQHAPTVIIAIGCATYVLRMCATAPFVDVDNLFVWDKDLIIFPFSRLLSIFL